MQLLTLTGVTRIKGDRETGTMGSNRSNAYEFESANEFPRELEARARWDLRFREKGDGRVLERIQHSDNVK